MESLHRFRAILAADLRERLRSNRFWLVFFITIGLTWLCFPPASAKYIIVGVNFVHRGSYSSAWVGMVLGVLAIWSSLIGFYLVRGNIRRDFETRVLELLEVTPMSRSAYLTAKWCSHMLVLAFVLIAQIAVGIIAQRIRAEDPHFDLAQQVMPALAFGLPSLAVTSMFAIWFDMVPWLRRSRGNYLYFGLWLVMVLAAINVSKVSADQQAPRGWLSDPMGITVFTQVVHERLDSQINAPLHICVGCVFPTRSASLFQWSDWHMAPMQWLGRLLWLLASIAAVLLGTLCLDRMSMYSRQREQQAVSRESTRQLRWIQALLAPLYRFRFGTLLALEISLSLERRTFWWWLGLVGAIAVQLAAPAKWAALGIIAAWMLLIPAYACAALREQEGRTASIVFTAAHAGRRILLARWLMLLLLGWGATLPAMLRFAVSAPNMSAAILVVGLSLAGWGIAIGTVTRSSRIVEMCFCILAYLGTQGVALLNVWISPTWTVSIHLVSLPIASIAIWIAWPRLQVATAAT